MQKRQIISSGLQTELQDISSSKKPWINVFSGPKTSKMSLSSWDTGVQKFDERKSQNSNLSLLGAFIIVRNSNQFQKWIEISHITDFDIFPTNFAALPYLPECPKSSQKIRAPLYSCSTISNNTFCVRTIGSVFSKVNGRLFNNFFGTQRLLDSLLPSF